MKLGRRGVPAMAPMLCSEVHERVYQIRLFGIDLFPLKQQQDCEGYALNVSHPRSSFRWSHRKGRRCYLLFDLDLCYRPPPYIGPDHERSPSHVHWASFGESLSPLLILKMLQKCLILSTAARANDKRNPEANSSHEGGRVEREASRSSET